MIEDSFGTEDNDLALNAMSRTIEATLLEIAGEGGFNKEEVKGTVID